MEITIEWGGKLMCRKCNFLFLISLITLLFMENIFAASPKSKTNKFTFSPSVDQLPPNFSGDDIRDTYTKLAMLFPEKKDEFETTKEYTAKLENNNVSVKDKVFVFTSPAHDIHYDADSNKLNYTVVTDYYGSSTVLIDSDYKDKGYYLASNALGAKVKVHESWTYSYYLKLTNSNFSALSSLTFSCNLSPQAAKDLINNQGLFKLYVCSLRLDDPNKFSYLSFSYNRKEPTISSPYDRTSSDYFINVHINELWLYNKATGKIYQKYKLES
jgi:hypothetical protein